VSEDLYGKVNGNEVLEGTVTLSADGTVTYAPAVVPEPGTFALAGLGVLSFTLRRRCFSKSA